MVFSQVSQELFMANSQRATAVPDSDAEIVKKVLKGDRDSFRLLVERYQRQVFTLCLRMVRVREDAEDCAQTTFVKAYTALTTYNPKHPFKLWVNRIAANSCLDMLRKLKSQPRVSLNDFAQPIELPVDSTDPRQQASGTERQIKVKAALTLVEDKYRLPLTLFYMEGLQCEEISTMLSLRLSTVKTRLRRGRIKLRAIMARRWPELIEKED